MDDALAARFAEHIRGLDTEHVCTVRQHDAIGSGSILTVELPSQHPFREWLWDHGFRIAGHHDGHTLFTTEGSRS